MAVVRLTDNKDMFIGNNQALELWKVLNGEIEGSEKDQDFALKVKKLHISWRIAPDSYLDDRADVLKPIVLNNFMLDAKGTPTRPEQGDADTVRVADYYRLLYFGKITPEGIRLFNSTRRMR